MATQLQLRVDGMCSEDYFLLTVCEAAFVAVAVGCLGLVTLGLVFALRRARVHAAKVSDTVNMLYVSMLYKDVACECEIVGIPQPMLIPIVDMSLERKTPVGLKRWGIKVPSLSRFLFDAVSNKRRLHIHVPDGKITLNFRTKIIHFVSASSGKTQLVTTRRKPALAQHPRLIDDLLATMRCA
jgi:hypothetical protein